MKENKTSKGQLWAGRVMSGLVILFMIPDAIFKFVKSEEAVEITTNQLGYGEHHLLWIGLIALICTLLYAIPRTAVLGAVLLTGYYGGAIATHVRVDNPLFSHTLFPVYLALLMWGGLWLRMAKVRQFIS